uniref:Uncharacterized protein n=1 Tax=viral metagenome TaxID=1070528 RepID=A0A6M3L8D8_9ZZZZ
MPTDPRTQTALSVQERAVAEFRDNAPLTFRIASVADELPEYGSKERDIALGNFWPTEPLLAGAVYSMVAKVAALDFRLRGPSRLVKKYKELLLAADFGVGNGWCNFISKVVQDLLTQDNGAFIELLRPEGASPSTAVHGVAHIDSQRCERTGNPLEPVRYRPHKGEPRVLKWYEALPLSDMPSPREEHYGRGLCAISRIMRAAQTIRDISIYKRQKLAGKRTPALLFASGISRDYLKMCIDQAVEDQLSAGQSLYTSPILIASMDSTVPIGAQMVELAGLPDGYDEDSSMKWYVTNLALAFGTDYTEFSPLPGGNLGSATQATEMAARARGKGPGVMLQQLEFAIGYWVLPRGVEFQFASTDATAEAQRVELASMRAKERATRIQSGEITPEQALELAIGEGDAPPGFASTEHEDRIDLVVRELAATEQRVASLQTQLKALTLTLPSKELPLGNPDSLPTSETVEPSTHSG